MRLGNGARGHFNVAVLLAAFGVRVLNAQVRQRKLIVDDWQRVFVGQFLAPGRFLRPCGAVHTGIDVAFQFVIQHHKPDAAALTGYRRGLGCIGSPDGKIVLEFSWFYDAGPIALGVARALLGAQ